MNPERYLTCIQITDSKPQKIWWEKLAELWMRNLRLPKDHNSHIQGTMFDTSGGLPAFVALAKTVKDRRFIPLSEAPRGIYIV